MLCTAPAPDRPTDIDIEHGQLCCQPVKSVRFELSTLIKKQRGDPRPGEWRRPKDPEKWIEFSISIYILASFSHSFFFGVFRSVCFLETAFVRSGPTVRNVSDVLWVLRSQAVCRKRDVFVKLELSDLTVEPNVSNREDPKDPQFPTFAQCGTPSGPRSQKPRDSRCAPSELATVLDLQMLSSCRGPVPSTLCSSDRV